MASPSTSASSRPSLGDLVAEATLSLYSTVTPSSLTHLPVRNGALEWTILSSVSLVLPPATPASNEAPRVIPISLGTGTKTTPYENLKGTPGDVLHDLHAEVLARRGARRWLAQRIAVEARWEKQRQEGQGDADVILDGLPLLLQKRGVDQRWQLREGIKVWWYVSTLPCGECSSPHLARRRAREDDRSTPKGSEALSEMQNTPPLHGDTPDLQTSGVLRGRQMVDESVARPRLRTVPGRPDAPPSLCHSCTDKLLLWSLLGWQGAALSRLATGRMPIDGLVVGASAVDLQENGGGELLLREIKRGLDVKERCNDGGTELRRRLEQAGLSHDLKPPLVEFTYAKFLQSQECIRERARAKGLHLEEATLSSEAAATKSTAAPTEEMQSIALIPAWESSSYVRPTSLDVKSGAKHADSATKGMTTAPVAKLEKLVYGIRQGASAKRPSSRLLSDGRYAPLYEKSRSKVCKLEHFRLMRDLANELGIALPLDSYAGLKGKGDQDDLGAVHLSHLKAEWYRRCKALLRNEALAQKWTWEECRTREVAVVDAWLRQVSLRSGTVLTADGDGGSSADVLQAGLAPVPGAPQDGVLGRDDAPLKGWLITPRSLEAFDGEGAWQ